MDNSLPECPICRKKKLTPLSAVYCTSAPVPAEKVESYPNPLRTSLSLSTKLSVK